MDDFESERRDNGGTGLLFELWSLEPIKTHPNEVRLGL